MAILRSSSEKRSSSNNLPRERLVLVTKCYFGVTADQPSNNASAINDGNLLNQTGLSRKHIIDTIHGSVARLGTYIDVLQIHRLDRSVPREEIIRTLNNVIESGKFRDIGTSPMAAWGFKSCKIFLTAKVGTNSSPCRTMYDNFIHREEENEMIPYCNHTGTGLVPGYPLRGALPRP